MIAVFADLSWRILIVLIFCALLGLGWFWGIKKAATIGQPTPRRLKDYFLLVLTGFTAVVIGILIAILVVR